MLSFKEPRVQRLGLPPAPHCHLCTSHTHPLAYTVKISYASAWSEGFVWIPPGDHSTLRTMKGLRGNQLEKIPIGFGSTASGKHHGWVSAQNLWLFTPFVLPLLLPISLSEPPPPPQPPPPQRAGSNCKAIPRTVSGNWSERCRQRGPLHSSLFTRSMYPIKGF